MRIKKFLLRFFGYSFLLLFLLVIALAGGIYSLKLPRVQTYLVEQAKGIIFDNLGIEAEIGTVDVGLPKWLILRDVVVYDKQHVALLQAKSLEVEMIDFTLKTFYYTPDSLQTLTIGRIELNEPQVVLYKSCRSGRLNAQELFASNTPKDTTKKMNPIRLNLKLSDLYIENARFAYTDSTQDACQIFIPKRINFNNVEVQNLNLLAHIETYEDRRISLKIDNLSLKERFSGFVLEKLSTQIINDNEPTYDKEGNCVREGVLKLSNLHIKSGKTHIDAYAELPDQSLQTLLSGTTPFNYYVYLQPSIFEFEVLDHFTNPIPPRGVVKIQKGTAYGNLVDVHGYDIVASQGSDIQVYADATVTHIDEVKLLGLDVKLRKGTASGKAIRELLPNVKLPSFLDNVGKSEVSGTFVGTPFDFLVDTDIHSPLGRAKSALHLQIPPQAKVKDFSYEGEILTENLNFDQIGIVPQQPISKSINFNGKIKGIGTDWKTLDLAAKGTLVNTTIVGLKMDSLFADLHILKQKISGYTRLNDGTGKVNAEIALDLANPKDPSYKVKGEIKQFNFQKYKILPQNLTFSGIVDVDLKGTNLDYLTGFANIKNGFLTYIKSDTTKNLKISDISFTARHPISDSLVLNVQSSMGNADVSGRMTITKIIKDIQEIVTETEMYFGNNDSTIKSYYAHKISNPNFRNVNLKVKTGPELNRIFDFFDLPLYMSDSSSIALDAKLGMTNAIDLRYRGDSLAYILKDKKTLKKDSLSFKKAITTLNFVKYADANNILLSGITEAKRVHYNSPVLLENNYVELDAFNSDVDITLKTEQPLKDGKRNSLSLASRLNYTLDGNIIASFNPKITKVHIADYDWKIQGKNRISYIKGDVMIDTLSVITDSIRLGGKNLGVQNIKAYGMISKNPHLPLFVWIKNLDLVTIDHLYDLGINLSGVANAQAQIFDIYKQPKIELSGLAQKVALGDNMFGDVHIQSRYDQIQEKIFATAYWITKDTLAKLEGNYAINNKISPLNFILSSQNDIPLTIAAPYLKGILYDLKGGLQIPNISITGNFQDLNIKGDGKIKSAGFGIDYLKTKYTFAGDVSFDKNRIEIKRLSLYDKYLHTAEFYAVLRHKNFKNIEFDLQLDKIKDMLVMETTKEDNDLFNGTIFVKDGLASISGDLQKVSIQAFGVTGKNSIFRLPISYENTYGMPDYIKFIGLDTVVQAVAKKGTELDINITVQATDEAEAELIFDEKIGDKIEGRGNGTMNISVTPQGDFVMNGMYEITEGKYLFTSQNALGKNFDVRKGGKIIWDGDPANAQIDLQAVYHVPNANAKTLIGSEKDIRIPADVVMRLMGDLMHPQIEPTIELPSLARSGVGSQTANDLNAKIKSFEFSPQEMNKQVMSLMIFNQFAPDATFSDPTGTAGAGISSLATTSISEFLSNQVNYWLSKSTGDKVNVALSSSNFQDINMLISAKFFDDRVTVERDGAIVGNNTSFSLGNINVIVKLLPSAKDTLSRNDPHAGELTLEVFNRSSIGSQQTNAYQVGAGVFYKKDFDSFRDLWRRKKKKEKAARP